MNLQVKSLFDFLNKNCTYLVLRNWDNLFDDHLYNEGHEDIDILCSNLEQFISLTEATRIHRECNRDNYLVIWNTVKIRFDVRWIGDSYYPEKMERAMLEHRILNHFGIYVPNDEDYYYSLLYHALIQKPSLSEEYQEKLSLLYNSLNDSDTKLSKSVFIRHLESYLIDNDLKAVYPHDPGVFINMEVISYVPTEKAIIRNINRKILLAKQRGKYYLNCISSKLKNKRQCPKSAS